jgi:hypothetical protein
VPYIRIAMDARALTMPTREFSTAHREPWNDFIREALRAIDSHNVMYFKTQNSWHLEKAHQLRQHVTELKEMIKSREK